MFNWKMYCRIYHPMYLVRLYKYWCLDTTVIGVLKMPAVNREQELRIQYEKSDNDGLEVGYGFSKIVQS